MMNELKDFSWATVELEGEILTLSKLIEGRQSYCIWRDRCKWDVQFVFHKDEMGNFDRANRGEMFISEKKYYRQFSTVIGGGSVSIHNISSPLASSHGAVQGYWSIMYPQGVGTDSCTLIMRYNDLEESFIRGNNLSAPAAAPYQLFVMWTAFVAQQKSMGLDIKKVTVHTTRGYWYWPDPGRYRDENARILALDLGSNKRS